MNEFSVGGVVGIVVSLLMEYAPKFNEWYNGLEDNYQKLFALALGFVVSFGAFGLACIPDFTLFVLPWPCDGVGFQSAFMAFLGYLLSNQATYLVLPKASE